MTALQKRKLLIIAVVALSLLFGAAGIVNLAQDSLIYHPRSYPANYRRFLPPHAAELPYRTAAGAQTAFYLPPRNGGPLPERIWVAFIGNAGLALEWTGLPPTIRATPTLFSSSIIPVTA